MTATPIKSFGAWVGPETPVWFSKTEDLDHK